MGVSGPGRTERFPDYLGYPRQCLTCPDMLAGMMNRVEERTLEEALEVLASFGEARVVRVKGRLHLLGGSMADRMEALEWLSMFMPEEAACLER